MLSDDFISLVTEHTLRTGIPGRDNAIERLSDDGVVRGFDDRSQAEAKLLGLACGS